jgi:cell division protein FtsZ
MLFITAGMGGGTGTGASPIIAKAARELDILTVGIITTPFSFEGKRRKMQAEEGMEELKKYVDSFLVISNDRLRQIFGNLTLGSAFAQADNILTTAAKGIAEIITLPGYINVDFKDVRTVMKDSGVSIMGSSSAEGDNRALKAVEGALSSPLLKDNEIEGARYILLNISSGDKEVTMDEVSVITDYIQEEAGLAADLIWGNCRDESLGDKLSVTIIATGFQTRDEREKEFTSKKIVNMLVPDAPLVKPVNEFITPVEPSAPMASSEPYMKGAKEEVKPQTGLFDLFATNADIDQLQAIKHKLDNYDEPAKEEVVDQYAFPEMTFKLSDPEDVIINFEAETPEVINEPEPEPTPVTNADAGKTDETIEEQLRKSRERIMRLKDLSMKLRSGNIQELENVPAYKRKEIALQQTPPSSESQVSRFTLLTDDEGNTEIRNNNSFLHDNVD